jgi:mannitol/fructose-specific phosphotransferase system IIA component (Ntr-type)
MDGTLSNDSHRIKHLNNGKMAMARFKNNGLNFDDFEDAENHFKMYHSLAIHDNPNEEVLQQLKKCIEDLRVETWIMTTRPSTFCDDTLRWLDQHLDADGKAWLMPDKLIMRHKTCTKPSCVIKFNYIKAEQNFVFFDTIVDNDESVIDAVSSLLNTVLYSQP